MPNPEDALRQIQLALGGGQQQQSAPMLAQQPAQEGQYSPRVQDAMKVADQIFRLQKEVREVKPGQKLEEATKVMQAKVGADPGDKDAPSIRASKDKPGEFVAEFGGKEQNRIKGPEHVLAIVASMVHPGIAKQYLEKVTQASMPQDAKFVDSGSGGKIPVDSQTGRPIGPALGGGKKYVAKADPTGQGYIMFDQYQGGNAPMFQVSMPYDEEGSDGGANIRVINPAQQPAAPAPDPVVDPGAAQKQIQVDMQNLRNKYKTKDVVFKNGNYFVLVNGQWMRVGNTETASQ